MTKSGLLDMIRQVSTISDQEVEELEKLVQNFPYCQTAHLLIAKAAYDQGNMLSNQKLRKAAAYATNRHLLKKLIYTTDAAVSVAALALIPSVHEVAAPHPAVPESLAAAAPVENILLDPSTEPALARADASPASTSEPAEPDEPALAASDEEATLTIPEESQTERSALALIEEEQPEELVAVPTDNITEPETDIVTKPVLAEDELPDTNSAISAETEVFTPEVLAAEEPATIVTEPEFAPTLAYFEPPVAFTGPELEELLQIEHFTRGNSAEPTALPDLVVPENNAPESNVPEEAPAAATADEALSAPTVAPIIRYELAAPDELEVPLEHTLADFDSYLFQPELDEHPTGELKPATPEEFNFEVFLRNQLGYWLGSSRLGEALQVKDELTTHTPLQFYPDLILEYSKQNYLTPTDSPPVSNVSRQFAIIDQFLKTNPKLKSFGSDKVRSEPQDDLAFKSTKNTKNLASENLATIMVQQGKIKKAIKIYEHLMVKIPEKKAYFTAQIEKLQNLP